MGLFAQDSLLIFDFNNHTLNEKNNYSKVSYGNVTLTTDRFGNENSALFIKGVPSSYYSLGTGTNVKPAIGTISMWVKLSHKVLIGQGARFNPIYYAKNTPCDDFNNALTISLNQSNDQIDFRSTHDRHYSTSVNSNESIKYNRWTHLLVTFDDEHLAAYMDGKLILRAPKNFRTRYWESDSVLLGHTGNKKNYRFSAGSFDDIRIYHRVLNEDEVLELYNAPNPNRTKIIIAEILKWVGALAILGIVVLLILWRQKKKQRAEREQLEIQNRKTELEIRAVRSQINPVVISEHLEITRDLIAKKELQKAGLFIAKLSYYLRRVLLLSEKQIVTLNEELALTELTIEIEKFKYGEQIQFNSLIESGIETDNVFVPPVTLQPLIEITLQKWLANSPRQKQLTINLHVSQQDEVLKILLEDDCVGPALSDESLCRMEESTTALKNRFSALNKLNNCDCFRFEYSARINEYGKETGNQVLISLKDVTY